jgi:NADH dehydrogenase
MTMNSKLKPKIIIVGAGFGGLFATKGLSHEQADITLIDQQNYHLFQPLLYQVATAGLAPSDIAWPIRGILSQQKNVTGLLDSVNGVDFSTNEVITPRRRLPFNYGSAY